MGLGELDVLLLQVFEAIRTIFMAVNGRGCGQPGHGAGDGVWRSCTVGGRWKGMVVLDTYM